MAVKKTRGVYFKATPEELQSINPKAKELHMTKSELMRRALFAYAEVWDGQGEVTHVAIDFGTWKRSTAEVRETLEEVRAMRDDVGDLKESVQTLMDDGLIQEQDGTVALWNLSKYDKTSGAWRMSRGDPQRPRVLPQAAHRSPERHLHRRPGNA